MTGRGSASLLLSLMLLASSMPSDARASGSFAVGANLPWIKYGLDFGRSGFGDFGLGSDCSEGFRPERFPGSDGVVSCQRSQQHVAGGNYSLEVLVSIAGSDPDRSPNGEVTTDFQDIADLPMAFGADLAGKTVTAQVFIEAGHRGAPSRPNYFQLFVKDAEGAEGLHSPALNIPDAGGWLSLSLTVGSGPTNFDPTRIRLLGVKIGIGGGSADTIDGRFWVDEIHVPDPDIVGFGFEDPSRAAIDVGHLTGAGVETLRWFVFADGRASPDFDAENRVTGLDDLFWRDFDEMLRLAHQYHFKVIPVLFDYLLCGNRELAGAVPLFGRADLIRDPDRRTTFLTNALGPLLDRYGTAPEILYWEVINEPEWCISDLALPPGINRSSKLPTGGAVTLAEMQGFVTAIVDFINAHPNTSDARVTLGSASVLYTGLWDSTGIDLCEFHLYNCNGCLDEGVPLPASSDCLLGEFAALESYTDRSVLDYLVDSCNGGYAGALPWSWRGRDQASPVSWSEKMDLLDDISAFVTGGYACSPLIFSDGFESGNCSRWSDSTGCVAAQ